MPIDLAVYGNVASVKLVDVCMIVVVDAGQFVAKFFFFQRKAFAQFRQRGIVIPQLRIDITDKDHGIFWDIHWQPPCEYIYLNAAICNNLCILFTVMQILIQYTPFEAGRQGK